ncbi:MAG: hypothetical protein CVU57_29590 [Deltaproteobacteria bacterium HGW-Deltaproteobacteria-15]|nr:MAG: hypothetical protein CVU57_29590 [Deltaproteobacteria bacterium HGW-Deltaproteobacteria-15]PKO01688.1 MAG: hypothetical protein CVU43_11745 [Chloroflexi bacterium HGW-Chloroflexi-5]
MDRAGIGRLFGLEFMRIALLFPPQWDPRQPPLTLPTLAACLAGQGHQVRAWDLNLFYYQDVLRRSARQKKNKMLIRQYYDPRILMDLQRFASVSSALENLLLSHHDPSGRHGLFWDRFEGPMSTQRRKDWQLICNRPEEFPRYHIFQPHLLQIIRWNPDIVCISIICDTQILGGLAIASGIRKGLRDTLIILGGHAVRERRNVLSEHKWLFRFIDAICISHGEPALQALAEGAGMADVPNVLWFDGHQVRYPRQLVPSSGAVQPHADFSVIPVNKYLTPSLVMPIETARGCPWSRCAFCGHPNTEFLGNASYFPRPIEAVIGELRARINQGWNQFFLVDEALPYDRFYSLSKEIIRQRLSISWICYLRLEKSHNLEAFRVAVQAGCRKAFFGLETGSGRLLRLYRKGFQPNTAVSVIRNASQAGLAVHLFLITGFPNESTTDQQQTEQLLAKVLPFADPFGFTYDVFPLSVELETPLFHDPTRFEIFKPMKRSRNDLASLIKPTANWKSTLSNTSRRIKELVDRHLGPVPGLRHFDISQDSFHLPLLAKRAFSEDRSRLATG